MEQNFPLLDKYPNYIFNFTGSRRYEFMKEYYPEEYAKVKQYVAAGRWVPAGSSVDECDANIPSLESFTRHFLYGNHFFQHEFGKQSDDFMLPDCFGFPASLADRSGARRHQGFLHAKADLGLGGRHSVQCRRLDRPGWFLVLAALNPGGYGNQINEDLSKSEQWLKRINEDGDKSGIFADYHYFGIGDRGGAAKDSTVEWVEKALVSGGPVRVIRRRSDQIFKDLTPARRPSCRPTRASSMLINHSAGSLSSEAYMKRWNRKNEQLAAAAEGAATTASWFGAFPYPYDRCIKAWDLVLGSQMHDIMPGTSCRKPTNFPGTTRSWR